MTDDLKRDMTVTALLIVIAAVAIIGKVRVHQDLVQAERPQPAAVRTLEARDGWEPIVAYDPADKRLTVTDHLAADALVCLTYAQGKPPACRLVRDWVQK